MPSRLNTPAAEASLSHGRNRGVWSESQLGDRQAMMDGREAEARAPSNAWLDAHERHQAKLALDHAARIPVPTGMMDWTLHRNLWKKKSGAFKKGSV